MQIYLIFFYTFAVNNFNMTEITIKSDNRKTIHNACLSIIDMMNLDNKTLAEKTGIAYNTAFKKRNNTQNLYFTSKDLTALMYYYDEKEKENIIKRRDILDLMHDLKIKVK